MAKFITENAPLNQEYDYRQRNKLYEALNHFYYPNRSNLVTNALLSGFHNLDNNLVVRATFDFLISHVPINSESLLSKDRARLMEGALLTLIESNFANRQRFFLWSFQHLESVFDREGKQDPAVQSCIEAS